MNIAIIDSGVDADNIELSSVVLPDNKRMVDNKLGHGTMIAGIIAADWNRGKVKGVSVVQLFVFYVELFVYIFLCVVIQLQIN